MKLLAALLLLIASAAPLAAAGYPPCLTEEVEQQAPCYWDAAHRGNLEGTSFIWTGSELVRLPF